MASYQIALERGIGPVWIGKTTKVCPQCKIEKPVEEFIWSKYKNKYHPVYCYSCHSRIHKEHRKILVRTGLCRECRRPRENLQTILCNNCAQKHRSSNKNWYEITGRNWYKNEWVENGGKDRKKITTKNRLENGGRKKIRDYWNKRYKNDEKFRLRCIMTAIVRSGINRANARNGRKIKSAKTMALVGLTTDELYEYLHQPGFWPVDKEGKELSLDQVEFDHIIPISYGYNKPQVIFDLLFHFSNIRPVPREVNQAKGDKLPEDFICHWLEKFTESIDLDEWRKINKF